MLDWSIIHLLQINFFQVHNALSDREILLVAILAHHEETPGLVVTGVGSHLEVIEVLQLLILLLVELQQLLNEFGIVAFDGLSILLEVQNGSRLRLNLADVQVVDSSDLVGSLGTLDLLTLISLSSFLHLLGSTKSILNAELEVATLLLPEFLEVLALSQFKRKWPLLDLKFIFAQFVEHVSLESQLGESNMAAVGVHSGVNQFEFGVLFLDSLFDLFPVDLEVFLGLNFSLVSDDRWIVEVLFNQNDFAIFVKLVLCSLGSFLLGLSVTLLDVGVVGDVFLGEGFVSSASDCVALEFELGRLGTSIFDVLNGPVGILDVVAVKEVGDGDVTVFGGLDLLAEELVLAEVLVGEVVFDLEIGRAHV